MKITLKEKILIEIRRLVREIYQKKALQKIKIKKIGTHFSAMPHRGWICFWTG